MDTTHVAYISGTDSVDYDVHAHQKLHLAVVVEVVVEGSLCPPCAKPGHYTVNH